MAKNRTAQVPNYATLIEATFTALKELGGSGRNDEINKKVYQILNVPDSVLEILHIGRASFSEIDYRLAWARTLLKNYGALVNSARRVWVISPEFMNVDRVCGADVEKLKNLNSKAVSQNQKNLANDQEQVDIPKYAKEIRKMLSQLEQDYHFSKQDAMLVLKDILYHEWMNS